MWNKGSCEEQAVNGSKLSEVGKNLRCNEHLSGRDDGDARPTIARTATTGENVTHVHVPCRASPDCGQGASVRVPCSRTVTRWAL